LPGRLNELLPVFLRGTQPSKLARTFH
jgi:hypothetical protein